MGQERARQSKAHPGTRRGRGRERETHDEVGWWEVEVTVSVTKDELDEVW